MFVKAAKAISPQYTLDDRFLNGELVDEVSPVYRAIEPDYSSLIPTGLLRRMGKAVRIGIGAGLPLLQAAGRVDGIMGTANGGLEDCVKFLNQIVEYEEGVLTPTNFVQSTPNAVAGQLALMTENTGYNSTHVNGSLSFENSLIDAAMLLEEKQQATLLVGAIEEFSQYNYTIDKHAGRYREIPVSNSQLIKTLKPGSICGEGSSMFIVSNDATDAQIEIIDVAQVTSQEEEEVEATLIDFLIRNQISADEVRTVALGRNGDARTDHFYIAISKRLTSIESTICFKEYCGEYRTAAAFGLYALFQLSKHPLLDWNGNQLQFVGNYALVYNQFDGIRHGFILVKKLR
jgi:hypothetical protein